VIAARTALLLTAMPSTSTGPTTSTAKPNSPPNARSNSASPSRLRPKLTRCPTTTARTPRPSTRKRPTKSRALMCENAVVNRCMMMASMPMAASRSTRERQLVSNCGARCGASTATGCG
jgi:hypothetical protein